MDKKKPDGSHIIITHHGAIKENVGGRKPMDLSGLKCIIMDECDVFFGDEANFAIIKSIAGNKQVLAVKPQYLLFSATLGGIGEDDKDRTMVI